MSLRAPIAVAVEIRSPTRRLFRLAANVGEDGVRLDREVPIERGRPVEARFSLPDEPPLTLAARVEGSGDNGHGDELAFVGPPIEARASIARYVSDRLGLPR